MLNEKIRSMPRAGTIAVGVFVVALILLLLFGYGFLGSLFLSLVLAAAVAAFLLFANRRSDDVAHGSSPSARPMPPPSKSADKGAGGPARGETTTTPGSGPATGTVPPTSGSAAGSTGGTAEGGTSTAQEATRTSSGPAPSSTPASANAGTTEGGTTAAQEATRTSSGPAPSSTPASANAGTTGGGSAAAPAASAPSAKPAQSEAPAPAASEAQPAQGGATVGTEPVRLDAPREGAPDDLKRIRGIGPKLEAQLNGMGIYHLDQIAGWSEGEVAWMDENLVEFRGRVSRDDWVGQARSLASGEETAVPRSVDDDDVDR